MLQRDRHATLTETRKTELKSRMKNLDITAYKENVSNPITEYAFVLNTIISAQTLLKEIERCRGCILTCSKGINERDETKPKNKPNKIEEYKSNYFNDIRPDNKMA
jgi:hypothetical protein